MFQSTHSRGVRLPIRAQGVTLKIVSIHALTRSATQDFETEFILLIVSIHALTRSATVYNQDGDGKGWFQSTHSRGVRLGSGFSAINNIGFQSTHSRGVRRKVGADESKWLMFQSTHSRGVRQRLTALASLIIKFQSTHSRGVRPWHGKSLV